jgi:hypothetical protein
VMRFVRKLRGASVREAHPVIVTGPGEEAQVDYGDGPMVRHPESGNYRRTRLFVLTLGFSRKSVRLLTWSSSSKVWCELHETAFRRLGGVPATCVLDNLKEGVIAADVYDPVLNVLYRDVLAHYGVVPLPCRVRHPDRKGKVESGVAHAQKTPLKGLRFEDIESAQRHLDAWEQRWADERVHGTTKRRVSAMFAEEQPHLRALPTEPFRYYRHGTRTVHLDGHVEIDCAYYSAPPGNIGRVLGVQWDERRVRILEPNTGELLREHALQERGRHRTSDHDRPSKTPSTSLDVIARARKAGPSIGSLAAEIHRREGEHGIRRVLGLLNLTKRHGAAAVDEACSLALSVGSPTYRFARVYLEKRPSAPSLKQIDPLIRDLTHYRDVIARMTKEQCA